MAQKNVLPWIFSLWHGKSLLSRTCFIDLLAAGIDCVGPIRKSEQAILAIRSGCVTAKSMLFLMSICAGEDEAGNDVRVGG
jgi:hypothetical protein